MKRILITLTTQYADAKHIHLVVSVPHGQFFEANDRSNAIGRRGSFQIAFVEQDRNGDALHATLGDEGVQFVAHLLEPARVGGIDQEDDGIAVAGIVLPQMPHGLVAAQVPRRKGNAALDGEGFEMWAVGGGEGLDGARSQSMQQRRLAGIVQAQQQDGPPLLRQAQGCQEGL